jgi:hypothetical protein
MVMAHTYNVYCRLLTPNRIVNAKGNWEITNTRRGTVSHPVYLAPMVMVFTLIGNGLL